MFRKNYLAYLLSIAVLMLGSISAFGQSSPVRGEVKLQKADGTQVPVANAVVEAFRTDLAKGQMPSAKTNKRGEFNFVGFPLGQTFVLSVSGPGIGPRIQPQVKGGMENVVIVVSEGDGRKLTEAEVREAATQIGTVPEGGISEARKKELAEIEKKNAEINAKNQQIQQGDAVARKASEEGFAAYKAKNYDLAITKFDEGVAAVPDYVGSTPILLGGKLMAMKERGFAHYAAGTAIRDNLAGRQEKYGLAKKEFEGAIEAFKRAMEVIKKAPAATDPKEQQQRAALVNQLYTNVIEVHRLMAVAQVDTSKANEAEAIINEYLAIETDPAKKANAQIVMGDIFRASGDLDKAIATYKKVLETTPDNTTVMASLGLSLVGQASAVDPPNREQLQEGLNYMQKYAETVQIAPTDSASVKEFKQSVKDTVEYLKTEQKLKPQAPAKRRN